jgi:hypothetical protein
MLPCPVCRDRPVTAKYAKYCDVCRTLCGHCREAPRAKASRWCNACNAAAMRDSRKRNPMTDEQRRKDNCRSYANVYLRRGKLVRQPCEVCGSADSQMHHHDYSKPLDVQWLCREHHLQLHKSEKRPRRLPKRPLYSRSWRGRDASA